jgi:hypothetical protein
VSRVVIGPLVIVEIFVVELGVDETVGTVIGVTMGCTIGVTVVVP